MASSVDIGKQQVAAVYAKALIGAAEKTGQTDDVVAELGSLVDDVLAKFPGFESTIGSPRLSAGEKNELIDRVFGGRGSEIITTFLKVLCQHERLDCLREVSREARRLHNRLRNRVEVGITTAHALSDQERSEIIHKLQVKMSCEVDLTHSLDETIIGGIVVRVGDTVIDGSVRNKLVQMRSQALHKVAEQIHDSGSSERFAMSS
jgi:F-type H+-transporting ATPase subunit delta